ncbi:hypothetical protein [Streptomyces noursei]|uniref:hypothetical protein n=1 Tax=Streptomyces noursei TaxID=1971 RepID=UPI0021A86A56|nr:hypothetical protein [Streptomyces noursei]UWS70092.1 hypothetical protein N1H47_01855 [Streptomyces noursei]
MSPTAVIDSKLPAGYQLPALPPREVPATTNERTSWRRRRVLDTGGVRPVPHPAHRHGPAPAAGT